MGNIFMKGVFNLKEREEMKHFGIPTFCGSDHVYLSEIDVAGE